MVPRCGAARGMEHSTLSNAYHQSYHLSHSRSSDLLISSAFPLLPQFTFAIRCCLHPSLGLFHSLRSSLLMLSLRPIRRFCLVSADATTIAAADTYSRPSSSIPIQNPKHLEPPALEKLKANARNRLVIENRFAFEDTVSRLAGATRFDYIEELLEQQKTSSQGCREGFIVRIIMLYGKVGMTKHAVDTFYDMHLYGCRRTAKSFNAALKVLSQSHKYGAIEEFFTEVPVRFDIEIDNFSVNIVIKALCEMGLLQEAYLIMLQTEERGVKPDVITYTTLMSAFYKNNRFEIGNGLWNLMVLKGCLPNLATFNARILFLINKGKAWDANALMKKMQRVGIAPDEVTFNLVMKGFYQAGYVEMAKRMYSALVGKGYKPNVQIYQTMIHYLCKSGDFRLAYTFCKDCMQKNWYPNVGTIYMLLEGLRKTGQIDKAKYIMMLARMRKPPFSPDHLNAMQSRLSRC